MIVFFISFIIYLFTLFSGLAPYRDTGEMTSIAYTLGIPHPPGYPFYALLSKIFIIVLPFGSVGYRLNILSALAGSLTVYIVYRIFLHLKLTKVLSSVLSLLFATSYLQWYLSLVSEMYTLNTLIAAALIYIVLKEFFVEKIPLQAKTYVYSRAVLLFAFVFGMGLGNRMDIVLLAAGLSWLFFIKRKAFSFSTMSTMALLFILGFSVFFYLPVRSNAGPFLDWNHPGDLSRFWGTLTRKTHGGTLDLLSTNYAPGENFISTIKFYLNHLFEGFAYLGILLGILGVYRLWKKDRSTAFALFSAWVITGPIFIYMANMPPNTHALVILEAHFLLPNLIFMVWIGYGFYFLYGIVLENYKKASVVALGGFMLAVNLINHFPQENKRHNFIAYDYAKNVLRSSPPDSIVVAKKDVQLFALWDKQLVEGKRHDVSVVSQGLSGSFWYIESWKRMHPDLVLGPLRTQDDWRFFVENNKESVFFTGDAEFPRMNNYIEEPYGLINRISKSASRNNGEVLLNYIYPYRGKYDYDAYREFFTPDLIDDYAKGWLYLGMYYMGLKEHEKARSCFKKALFFKELFPLAFNYIAYTYVEEGKYDTAREMYIEDIKQYKDMIKMANEFNSLSDVKESLNRELSEMYISLGVCCEKLGKEDESLNYYQSSVDVSPGQAKAYFNRSVIYWKRGDWQRVVIELENALKIDPQYREAAYYLQLAQKNLTASQNKR